MKLHKLFLSIATGGLLLGASGAAVAQDAPVVDDWADGTIVGERVDAITIDGTSCHIEDVVVDGAVTITNSPAITMIDVETQGNVSVTGPEGNTSRASLTRVVSYSGSVTVNGHNTAIVSGVITRGAGDPAAGSGDLTVNNNTAVAVLSNLVIGNLTCTGNGTLETYFNRVGGVENCVETSP